MREHMSRNRLAILPDLTHYEMFAAPQMARTVLPFSTGRAVPRAGRIRYKEMRQASAARWSDGLASSEKSEPTRER